MHIPLTSWNYMDKTICISHLIFFSSIPTDKLPFPFLVHPFLYLWNPFSPISSGTVLYWSLLAFYVASPSLLHYSLAISFIEKQINLTHLKSQSCDIIALVKCWVVIISWPSFSATINSVLSFRSKNSSHCNSSSILIRFSSLMGLFLTDIVKAGECFWVQLLFCF